MAAYDDFFDYVLPEVPSCSQALARTHIRAAAIEWCRRTKRYQHTPTPMDGVGGTKDYAITVPSQTVLSDVITAFYGSANKISPASPTWLDANVSGWRSSTGNVEYFYVPTPATSTIRLVMTPAESQAGALDVTVAVVPTLVSTVIPDWLLQGYHTDIAHGALARIFAIPRKPWTDRTESILRRNLFNAACGVGDAQALRGGTRAPIRATTDY